MEKLDEDGELELFQSLIGIIEDFDRNAIMYAYQRFSFNP